MDGCRSRSFAFFAFMVVCSLVSVTSRPPRSLHAAGSRSRPDGFGKRTIPPSSGVHAEAGERRDSRWVPRKRAGRARYIAGVLPGVGVVVGGVVGLGATGRWRPGRNGRWRGP